MMNLNPIKEKQEPAGAPGHQKAHQMNTQEKAANKLNEGVSDTGDDQI